MPPRPSRTALHISDVNPTPNLRLNNCDPLVERLKEYSWYYATNPAYLFHLDSRKGAYTDIVNTMEAAGTQGRLRNAYGRLAGWADRRGVTIT